MSMDNYTHSESTQADDFNAQEAAYAGVAVNMGMVQVVKMAALGGFVLGVGLGAAPLIVVCEACEVLAVGHQAYKFWQWMTSEEEG
jgi:hypothetical protein